MVIAGERRTRPASFVYAVHVQPGLLRVVSVTWLGIPVVDDPGKWHMFLLSSISIYFLLLFWPISRISRYNDASRF